MEEIDQLRAILATHGITDLVINGFDFAQADFGEGLIEVASPFHSDQSMVGAMVYLALEAGARLDIAKPIADFSLAGARFNAVLPQGVSKRPLLSIRVHPTAQVQIEHLMEVGMITSHERQFLMNQLERRSNLLISGATSSGKTTLLSAMLAEIHERVLVIEQTPELRVGNPKLSITERISNQEGLGAIELDQLVVHALRMRPDRIVVGEVRSKEFKVLLQAMNNGHSGTMATLHATSLEQIPQRLMVLGLLSGLTEDLTKKLSASSIDFCIQLARRGGKRRIEGIGIPKLVAGELLVERIQL